MRFIALMPETIFLEISLIWHSQERFPSMWTPRDFEVETCLIGNLLISILGFLSSVDSLCLDPINKNSVLVVFSVSLFAASHIRILSKSMLTHRSFSSTSLLAAYLSSAYLSNPRTSVASALVLQCSTNWAMRTHTLGAGPLLTLPVNGMNNDSVNDYNTGL